MKQKYIYSVLSLLLAMFSVIPAMAENYDIRICETTVTSSNRNDVLGNGKVSYNPSTKTLTIKSGTTLDNQGAIGTAIFSGVDGLTLKFEGNATITARNHGIWTYNAKMKIIGTGGSTIKITCGAAAIGAKQGELEITSVGGQYVIEAKSTSSSISPLYGENGKITITGYTSINIQPSPKGAISGFTSVNFDDWTAVALPSGATYNTSEKVLKNVYGENVTNEVTSIVPKSSLTTYNLRVAGMYVNNYNCGKITSPAISGSVKYTPSTHTLTIDGASISGNYNGADWNAIQVMDDFDADLLTVKVNGNNYMYAKDGKASVASRKSLTISGPGSMLCSQTVYLVKAGTLTFDNVWVQASDVIGSSSETQTLVVKNDASLHLGGKLAGFEKVTFSGVDFSSPVGAYYDTTDKRAENPNGSAITNGMEIESVTKYGIKLNNKEVHDKNASDFFGNGTVRYDASNQTLYLKNASLNTIFITSSASNTIIHLSGDNSCKQIRAQKELRFMGNGSLEMNPGGSENAIIADKDVYMGSLNDSDSPTINIVNSYVGINGSGTITFCNYGGTLYIRSLLNPFYGTDAVNGYGSQFTQPYCAYYDTKQDKVCTYDGTPIEGGYVAMTPVKEYMMVGTTVVHSENYESVLGAGINGGVKFNPNSNELTLTNADITVGDLGIINLTPSTLLSPSIPSYTVLLEGNNRIRSTGWFGIYSSEDLKILGPGSLELINNYTYSSVNGTCINCDKGTLAIENCDLQVTSEYGEGIKGQKNATTLLVRNSKVSVASVTGAVVNFRDVTLDNSYISWPVNAQFNESLNGVASGNQLCNSIEIERLQHYGLAVAGTNVTNLNYDNIQAPNLTGTASYNPETNTLTLNNVNYVGSPAGISNLTALTDKELTIVLEGNNLLQSSDAIALALNTSATIRGAGTLTLDNPNDRSCIGRFESCKRITIKDGATVRGGVFWLNGAELVVDDATLIGTGGLGNTSLGMLGGVTVAIPYNGHYDAGQTCLVDNNGVAAEYFEIRKLTAEEAGIDGTFADSADRQAVYNTSGQRTATTQRGVNIIRLSNGQTRKVMVK